MAGTRFKRFVFNSKHLVRRAIDKTTRTSEKGILDAYVMSEPSAQNALDIFKGEWSSKLPEGSGLTTEPGPVALFEDERVKWAEDVFGSFNGLEILELGPLEGGHSYMFQQRNAARVTAIEANTRAYLKCLTVKEVLKLDRVDFLLGDFISYLENCDKEYDMAFASGVLYHMVEPIRLIRLLSGVTDRVFIWSHYYDAEVLSRRVELAHKFSAPVSFEDDGVSYEYSEQSYKESLGWAGFCGGPERVSKWLTRDSMMRALEHYGLTDIEVSFDAPDHPNGPALALCAKARLMLQVTVIGEMDGTQNITRWSDPLGRRLSGFVWRTYEEWQ